MPKNINKEKMKIGIENAEDLYKFREKIISEIKKAKEPKESQKSEESEESEVGYMGQKAS